MLFDLPTPAPEPAAVAIANSLMLHANRALSERIAEHRSRYHEFWDGPATPAEIAAALGPHGAHYLAAASESARHIATLAALAGQQLDDVLPPEDYAPRLPLTTDAATGTLTVGAVEGLDAWGRAIQPLNPEPEPQP